MLGGWSDRKKSLKVLDLDAANEANSTILHTSALCVAPTANESVFDWQPEQKDEYGKKETDYDSEVNGKEKLHVRWPNLSFAISDHLEVSARPNTSAESDTEAASPCNDRHRQQSRRNAQKTKIIAREVADCVFQSFLFPSRGTPRVEKHHAPTAAIKRSRVSENQVVCRPTSREVELLSLSKQRRSPELCVSITI